ncbi:MAG TPA: DUF1569 domain-containing protein [Thermoanaerobaculia bacterium]|jgi:hypothetical protein
MKSLWNETDRAALLRRVQSVGAHSQRQWGTMSADGMLSHLLQSLQMMKGDLPVKSKKLPLRFFPLKQLVIYFLPFPKGAPTAPELLPANPRALDVCHGEIAKLFDALVAHRGPWPEHPAFGKLSHRAAGVLIYRHFDHHLRQFGA